ncbi:hypothetical protein DPMN_183986 [Dreissena polymorpha]|uniref:Uncharacterized protein n=1 Tax=Dreissena polymorpha TaxID=45954 RepID=A0A9D4DID3_DREPO|nr:hypothetical protein DPMN_183986 [Dreissena polymorpha]
MNWTSRMSSTRSLTVTATSLGVISHRSCINSTRTTMTHHLVLLVKKHGSVIIFVDNQDLSVWENKDG